MSSSEAWLRFVRSVNENRPLQGSALDISDFMFGSGRAPLEVYRPIHVEYQQGGCFYCRKPLRERTEVNHFIPWSGRAGIAVPTFLSL